MTIQKLMTPLVIIGVLLSVTAWLGYGTKTLTHFLVTHAGAMDCFLAWCCLGDPCETLGERALRNLAADIGPTKVIESELAIVLSVGRRSHAQVRFIGTWPSPESDFLR